MPFPTSMSRLNQPRIGGRGGRGRKRGGMLPAGTRRSRLGVRGPKIGRPRKTGIAGRKRSGPIGAGRRSVS